MRRIYVYILIAAVTAGPLFANGQIFNDHNITHYTSENGLPQNSVSDLTVDSHGFLWLCTQGGLCRFDGTKFKIYNSNNSILTNDRVANVELVNGKVLVQSETFTSRFYSINNEYQLVNDSLQKEPYIYFSKDGPPIVLNNILPHYINKPEYKEIEKIFKDFFFTLNFIPVSDHELYIYRDEDLWYFDNAKGIAKKCATFKLNDYLSNKSIACGNVLLLMDKEHRYYSFKDGVQLSSLPLSPAFADLLAKLRSRNAFIGYCVNQKHFSLLKSGKDIWIVKNNNGILDAALLFGNINLSSNIECMFYNEGNGILYAGTLTDGFYSIQKNPFSTIIFDTLNIMNNNVYEQLQIDPHKIITRSYWYEPVTGKADPLNKKLLPETYFYRAKDSSILYCSRDKVIIADKNFVTKDSIHNSYYPDDYITSFLDDSTGKIWFTIRSSFGFIKDRKLNYQFLKNAYFEKNKISTIFEYSKNILWIAHANGIIQYNKTSNTFDTSIYLPQINIRAIYRAKDSSIWIGTYGKGFYKYLDGRFIRMPVDENKYLLVTHSFNEDNNGFFWIPTNNGLFQCSKKELDAYALDTVKIQPFYYYYKKCGKYGNEFNGSNRGAVSVFSNNFLFLSSIKGVIRFSPDSITPYLPNSTILVEAVEADKKISGNDSAFSVPPGFERLELTVSAPYFQDNVNNVIEYKLEDMQESWLPIDKTGKIVYNRLPEGTYHLTVRKRTGFGNDDYAYKKIVFTVEPFWYQKLWFKILMGLLTASIVYGIFLLRIRALHRRRAVLEEIVKDRTADLNNTITELHESEQKVSSINQVQEKAIAVILHDIQSPINYLSMSAFYFNKQVKNMPPEDIEHYAQSLAESSGELKNFTSDLLQWLISKQDNFTAMPEPFNLNELIKEISDLYSEIIKFNNNAIKVLDTPDTYITTDKNKLKLIVRNLVDNANKNSVNGLISLGYTVDKSNNTVVISVTDTGKGMTKEQVETLLADNDENVNQFKNGKLGFTLVRDFLKLIGGQMEIESEPGKGTTIKIILQL